MQKTCVANGTSENFYQIQMEPEGFKVAFWGNVDYEFDPFQGPKARIIQAQLLHF